ncbi:unnamed protein product [Rotaria sordida]|uniref:G-protein coupled receptors family 1 profile domain-containing protein n=1 Tax=Rotaria sordida TaxID=392033 RepID=A0A814LR91_9BILA|nr:unnamed protein product [Rotaria sordida]CAF1249235.1 unnamed protein product [Rotaria sordida]
MEWLDAIVVIASFVLDIVMMYKDNIFAEISLLFISLRLWRLTRIINSVAQTIRSEDETKKKHLAAISFGQWIFSALELIPSLLIGDMEYLHNDYHCQVAPSSMRGSLIVCVLGFLFPFIIIACSYVYTIYYIRQHSSTIITTKQRKSMRRDMIILKRVLIILTLLTSSAAPHAFFPVAYRFLGSLPTCENECVTMYGTGLDHLHQQPKSTGIN